MKRNKRRKLILSILLILLLVALSGCIPGDGSYTPNKPANILSGIWHGWIAPLSLLLSIGRGSIKMYETINTGFGYEFGFYIAIISGFGGLSLFRKKKK